MKTIKDIFLFDMQDKAVALKSKMLAYNPNLDCIDLSMIEEQLTTIKRRFNYPAKNIILNELGISIKPVYNKERITLPTYLPAYLINNPAKEEPAKVIVVVNLTNHATITKDKTTGVELLNIDNKQLFGLLQCGEIFLTCFRKWNSITMSQSICKLGSLIYSRLIVKVLDKMFAVNFDPVKSDKIKFMASKFFLLNLLEKSSESDIINNTAFLNCTNKTTRNTINQFDEEVGNNAYIKFNNFIQQIQLHINGCGALTVRTFLDTAIGLYGQSTVLAFEYLPLFLHLVFSVVIGARFNNEFVLESVLGREADSLYTEFVGFMRN